MTCHCPLGYLGNGYQCYRPCDIQNGGCHPLAECTIMVRFVLLQLLSEVINLEKMTKNFENDLKKILGLHVKSWIQSCSICMVFT